MHGAQGNPTLLSAETFKKLPSPVPKQGYSVNGWAILKRPWAGGLALTHSGSNTRWYCTVWIAPQKNFAILIAINYGSGPAGKAADEGIGKLIEFNSQVNANN